MSYDAKVLEVMIASPSDVVREREVVRSVISGWNDIHARSQKLVLLSVGWDTHSSPDLAGRPQQIINDRILDKADIVVGIFWTKIGSPTGKASSGSVEEIQNHRRSNKPVMLYFSDAPVVPGSYDAEQFAELLNFKEWAKKQGLVSTFSDAESFRHDFSRHLQIILRDNEFIRSQTAVAPAPILPTLPLKTASTQLTQEGINLLKWAADPASNQNMIAIRRYLGGVGISAGSTDFKPETNREVAKWEGAIMQLFELGLTRDINGKREIFELNDRGYQAADTLLSP